MNKGYDSASITVLQEELQMSRGAMYRYFRNKEELFIAVIDGYFFNIYGRLVKSLTKSDLLVVDLIELIYRRQRSLISAFVNAGVTHAVFLNYTALMIQAAKYYPGFIPRFEQINRELKQCWEKALMRSIEKKEIRNDIRVDIFCSLFMNACTSESSIHDYSDASMFGTNILEEIDGRREVMYYLYSLMKIK
jgi:AcrR family transcriptional regulator